MIMKQLQLTDANRFIYYVLLSCWSCSMTCTALQLKITKESLKSHQTTVSANSPLDPPIQVVLIDEKTGLVERDGENARLEVTAKTLDSTCVDNSNFQLKHGVGIFMGSFCEVVKAKVYLYFISNTSQGLLSTNFSKPISIDNTINIAYFRPDDKSAPLNDCLESFMHFMIFCLNDFVCCKNFLPVCLKDRKVKMKTYQYKYQNPSSQFNAYLRMKDNNLEHPEEKAYAIVGFNDHIATETLLPLLVKEKFSVLSHWNDDRETSLKEYPLYNSIHISKEHLIDSALRYLEQRKWSKIIVICNNNIFERVKWNFPNMTIRILRWEIHLDRTANFQKIFNFIIRSGLKVIINNLYQEDAKNLLFEAKNYNITSQNNYQWVGLDNVKYFDFLVDDDEEKSRKEEHIYKVNPISTLIEKEFKGMIFLSFSPMYIRENVQSLFNQYIRTISSDIYRNIIDNSFDRFTLAHDSIIANLYALKIIFSKNGTSDGESISYWIRNNSFVGMTGEIHMNQKTGHRSDYKGIVHVVWPNDFGKHLFNFIKGNFYLNKFGFIYSVISFKRKGNDIIKSKIMTLDLYLFASKLGITNAEKLYNSHILVSIWNNINVNKSLSVMNRIRVESCKEYFHSHKKLYIENPIKSVYDWYWPELSQNCHQELRYIYAPPPFFCELGCGGKQIIDDVLEFINGKCIAQNICECRTMRWKGLTCSIPMCSSCNRIYGTCISPEKCNCSIGYLQPNCSVVECPHQCINNGGYCTKPGVCECDSKHYGRYCNETCVCQHGRCDNGIFGTGRCIECLSEYYGENCQYSYITLFLYIIMGIICLWVIVYSLFKAYTKELQLKETLISTDWVINWTDVKKDDLIRKGNMIISAISTNCSTFIEKKSLNIGIYGELKVYYQKLNRDTIEISREIQLDMKQVRELKHLNLVTVLGCSIQAPNVAIFTELQNKGSLKDILLNDDIEIPWKFRYSMMKDICKGLSYIHNSTIKSHGRLKSSNCLIDNKWVVKLTGFGLHSFRSSNNNEEILTIGMPREGISGVINADFGSLLWTSPELLRKGYYHIDHVNRGSVHGDIYSFGMILSEFCTMKLPFFDLELDKAHLVNLIAGFQNPSHLKVWNDYIAKNNFEEGCLIRPCIQDKQYPSELEAKDCLKALIESCWDDDPRMRPSCKECEILLFKLDPQRIDPMEHQVGILETYSTNLENVVHKRNDQLQNEVKKTDNLVLRLLPKIIVEDLKQGKNVESKNFKEVTILCCKIIGFSFHLRACDSSEVLTLMSSIYELFDNLRKSYGIYRVEAVNDEYMFVSGLFDDVSMHADLVCMAALSLIDSFNAQFALPGKSNLQLQVGIHTGSVMGTIIGLKTPRYSLFGDTVNIAGKIQAYGKPSHIHISENTLQMFSDIHKFDFELVNEIKYKTDLMKTYWLKARNS